MDNVDNVPRILVIDDDESFRHLISVALTNVGYAVRTAIDGMQGLELVESFKPDLIYLDVQMPVMGGEAFLEAFLRRPQPHVPVIALTAAGNLGDVIEIGVDDFIAKPFTIDTLYAYTKRYLRTPGSASGKPKMVD